MLCSAFNLCLILSGALLTNYRVGQNCVVLPFITIDNVIFSDAYGGCSLYNHIYTPVSINIHKLYVLYFDRILF